MEIVGLLPIWRSVKANELNGQVGQVGSCVWAERKLEITFKFQRIARNE